MSEIRTFKVPRGIAGGTKKLDKKVAELQSEGWTIRDVKQPTTLNPNFYIEAERGSQSDKVGAEGRVGEGLGTAGHDMGWAKDDIADLKSKLDEMIALLKEIRDRQ